VDDTPLEVDKDKEEEQLKILRIRQVTKEEQTRQEPRGEEGELLLNLHNSTRASD
jgi:hypothetical protein